MCRHRFTSRFAETVIGNDSLDVARVLLEHVTDNLLPTHLLMLRSLGKVPP